MTRPFPARPLQFYLTAPGPCPYLDDRSERKVFAHLDRRDGAALNDALTHAGFRRSQSIVYRPACEGCDACLSSRVPSARFEPSRNQKRIIRRNADLIRAERAPKATEEQFELLTRYLETRHADGGMTGMVFGDYAQMVADTPARTELVEYRRADDDKLMAAALVDRLCDGFSLVYSFFEPDEDKRSLGAFMILDHLARAAERDVPYVYLGYWVEGSAKMAYKERYRPFEVLANGAWRSLDGSDAVQPPQPTGRAAEVLRWLAALG